MQLEFEQRQFLNSCVAKARAYERSQLATQVEQLRALIEQERASMRTEVEALRLEIGAGPSRERVAQRVEGSAQSLSVIALGGGSLKNLAASRRLQPPGRALRRRLKR
jgi:hypothetical protein